MAITDHRKFYNSASEFYDEMINLSSSIDTRTLWFKRVIKPEMKKAADIGCGSGLDSISLSRLGLQVTGFDVSDGMIQQARKNAEEYKVNPEFQRAEIDKINKSYHNTFDLVSSLGNTAANIEPPRLTASIEKIYDILVPKGVLILQILNYQLIVKEQERIINIRKSGQFTYVRFYDFHADHLDFNILRFETDKPESRKLISTKIYPYTSAYLNHLLRDSGFRKIRFFGSLKMEEFDKNTSKDLIILAERPARNS